VSTQSRQVGTPEKLDVQPQFAGLSSDEARVRLARHGPNRLVRTDRTAALRELLLTVADPMALMLALASACYLWLGDARCARMSAPICDRVDKRRATRRRRRRSQQLSGTRFLRACGFDCHLHSGRAERSRYAGIANGVVPSESRRRDPRAAQPADVRTLRLRETRNGSTQLRGDNRSTPRPLLQRLA